MLKVILPYVFVVMFLFFPRNTFSKMSDEEKKLFMEQEPKSNTALPAQQPQTTQKAKKELVTIRSVKQQKVTKQGDLIYGDKVITVKFTVNVPGIHTDFFTTMQVFDKDGFKIGSPIGPGLDHLYKEKLKLDESTVCGGGTVFQLSYPYFNSKEATYFLVTISISGKVTKAVFPPGTLINLLYEK